jgi:hypothetical protein
MIEIKPMSEQEMETEKFVKEFLRNKGIDPSKIVNQSTTFLTGIYNGLMIANSIWALYDVPLANNVAKDARIILNYVNLKKKRVRESLVSGMDVAPSPTIIVPPPIPEPPKDEPVNPVTP